MRRLDCKRKATLKSSSGVRAHKASGEAPHWGPALAYGRRRSSWGSPEAL